MGQDEFRRRRAEQIEKREGMPDFKTLLDEGGLGAVELLHIEEALRAAYAREHDLVQRLEASAELLRTRTIERDHARETGHVFELALALMVDELGGEVELEAAAVNGMQGRSLEGNVVNGVLVVRVVEAVPPSPEGEAG